MDCSALLPDTAQPLRIRAADAFRHKLVTSSHMEEQDIEGGGTGSIDESFYFTEQC